MTRKLIWAIDMSDSHREEQKNLLPLIEIFAGYMKAAVQPLFVFNKQSLGSDITVFSRVYGVAVDDIGQAVFKNFLPSRPAWMEEGHLLMSDTYTRRGMIKDLMSFAHRQNASMIVTFSRLKAKALPGFFGGFTDTLLLLSDIPVLTAHPGCAVPESIRHILYPCDPDHKDDESLRLATEFAQAQNARLTLFFNQSEHEKEYADFPQFLTAKDYEVIVENRRRSVEVTKQIGESLAEKARDRGVNGRFVCISDNDEIAGSIVDYAAAHAVDLIMMTSRTGIAEGLFFGSVTREVVRQAKCPVWALHRAA